MKRLLLPVLLALIGLGGGIGAGLALKPASSASPEAASQAEAAADASQVSEAIAHDYVKLNNQFIVPVLEDGKVRALVILSLSLEVVRGSNATIFAVEPKLRDGFLSVLFDHANSGGFQGEFTSGPKMEALRRALLEVAQKVVGRAVTNVLITDLVRQDT